MQIRRATMVALATLAAAMVQGCRGLPSSGEEVSAKRFEGRQAGQEASSEAVDLTERYTQLFETAAALKQENQGLAEENGRLKRQIETLEVQLKQAQAELTEANGLLLEMLGELNNWKSDILGFRNEMRQAAKTQLEALLKILETLGAETSLLPPAAEPNQPQPGGTASPASSGRQSQ